MQHVEEVLNLMAAVSGDRRFEAAQNDIKERKITKMEDWLTRALDNATEKGIEKGIEQACSILNSTVNEYEDAKELLADVPAGEFC